MAVKTFEIEINDEDEDWEDDEDDSQPENDYWVRAREPLASLVFLLPLLIAYEAGALYFGGPDPAAVRNGADFWMRSWLERMGIHNTLLLPALVLTGLLAWQVIGKYEWKVRGETLVGMFAESILFAFVLVVAGQTQGYVFQQMQQPAGLSIASAAGSSSALTFIGAGLYEEVLFRLMLLPACYGIFRATRLSRPWAAGLAVVSTSLLFSFAHYLGGEAYQFTVYSFTFRALAGMFFAALFVLRGFGITAGCHAAYDLIVGLLIGAAG